jgi:large subunit ribosomal protein L6
MLSIIVPKNVKISWGENFIKVVGPLGSVVKKKMGFDLALKDSRLYILNAKDILKSHFYLSLIRSIITGVSKGYRRKLRLVGVGFKASVEQNKLILKIGFSHEVIYEIPTDVQILCSKVKGTLLLIKGKDLNRVRQVASEIREFRKPDSYKGKGIHSENEILKLKKGKREGK